MSSNAPSTPSYRIQCFHFGSFGNLCLFDNDVDDDVAVVNEANREVLESVNHNDFIVSQREGSSFHDWCVQCEDRYDTREVEDRGQIGPLTYCGNCYPAQKDYGAPSKKFSLRSVMQDDKYQIRTFLVRFVLKKDPDYLESHNGLTYCLIINASGTSTTQLYVCVEKLQRKLYWYDQYMAILNTMSAFIFPCGLSDGTIGVCIWRTRCNRPKNHLLVYQPNTKECFLITTSWITSLQCDLSIKFDQDEVRKYVVCNYLNTSL